MKKAAKLITVILMFSLLFLSACDPPKDPGGGVTGGGTGKPPDDPNGGGDPGGGSGGRWAIIFRGSEIAFPEMVSQACQDNVFEAGTSLDFTAVELTGEQELRFELYHLVDPESGLLEMIHRENFAPQEMRARIGLPAEVGSMAGAYYLTVGSAADTGAALENQAQLPASAYCFTILGS